MSISVASRLFAIPKGSLLPRSAARAGGTCIPYANTYLPSAAAAANQRAVSAAAAAVASNGGFASRRGFSTSGVSSQVSAGASVREAVEALWQELETVAAEKRERMQRLKTNFGAAQVGAVTPQNILGGMRGLTALLTETSVLDAETGLCMHGVHMRDLLQHLPKMREEHEYPSVESLLWFLLTSKVPTASQVSLLQRCLCEMFLFASDSCEGKGRVSAAAVSSDSYTEERFRRVPLLVSSLVKTSPAEGHPMTCLTAAAAALSDFSFFKASVDSGIVGKKDMWKPAVVDALTLVVRAAVVAAEIYRKKFGQGAMPLPDPNLDFAANFARLLGFESKEQTELIRLYLLLHADHEGGNVSAHAAHLVGSALADPFAAYAAGMAGLGGPLHGLANQKCLAWLRAAQQQLQGAAPTKEKIREIALASLKSGRVIPGFGHAVLRVTDPRFSLQREFALRHIQDDPLFQLLEIVSVVVPEVLAGKVANPYPNVDCHSGVLLQALGLTEERFYTVLFGVSRAMGIASQFVWARTLSLPIERPKSIDLHNLEQLCVSKQH